MWFRVGEDAPSSAFGEKSLAHHLRQPDLLLRSVRRTGLGRNGRQGRRPSMDHDQPPRREPHSHRSRVDRRVLRRPYHPHLGDDVAELAHPARIRDLLLTNAVTTAPGQPRRRTRTGTWSRTHADNARGRRDELHRGRLDCRHNPRPDDARLTNWTWSVEPRKLVKISVLLAKPRNMHYEKPSDVGTAPRNLPTQRQDDRFRQAADGRAFRR